MNKLLSLPFILCFSLLAGCVVTDDEQPVPDPEPTSLRTGLIFHVPFSGNADDIGVNGFSGTVTGATITSDRHGVANEAYRFDGVDDYINYGPAAELAFGGRSTYTMTAWVKLEDRNDQLRNVVISKFNGGVAAGWYLSVNADEEIQAYRNATPWSVSGGSLLNYGEYMHLAASFDGSDFSVWVNGVLDGTGIFGSHPSDSVTDVLIGGSHSQNTVVPLLKGVVDDVRIYNRVLTGDELTWLATH